MCGRFTINLTYEQLNEYVKTHFDIYDNIENFDTPRYNVAPGTNIISVINDGISYRVGTIKWGFKIPINNKSVNIINVKAENIFTSKLFKPSALSKRCLIIADSFYEWGMKKEKGSPQRIMLKSKEPFSMAGIYVKVLEDDGKPAFVVAIITTVANTLVQTIHDRMPVILSPEKEKIWLDNSIKDVSKLKSLLSAYPAEEMCMYKVSNKVNDAANDYQELIEEVC